MAQTELQSIDRSIDWSELPQLAQWTLEQGLAIQHIPAPTFEEAARAEYIADQFRQLGLIEITTDDKLNVYGLLKRGSQPQGALMITAHLDTVFAADTPLNTRQDGNVIYGPGLGDNSLGVAGMLALAKTLAERSDFADCDVWFVATTGEEGLGDLGGMKAAFTRLGGQVRAVINLEGMALGHVYCAGIAVRRLHITARTSGGHSWLHFGKPSAIHGIMTLGARIAALETPQSPRTTFNIGMIDGGTTINAIAAEASLWLDLRSEDSKALAALENAVRVEIKRLASEELHFEVEVVGDRPAGRISSNHPLIQTALAALAQINIRGSLESGSTDANIPLAHGCPAVTVGVSRGGNAHRLDEYIEVSPITAGLRQLILLTLGAARLIQSQHV